MFGTQREEMAKPDAVATPYRLSGQGHSTSVHTALVDAKGRSTFAKLLIEAQAPGLVSRKQVWHTNIGGANVCDSCSRLALEVVPQHTHRILVQVILPVAVSNALLYLSRHNAQQQWPSG